MFLSIDSPSDFEHMADMYPYININDICLPIIKSKHHQNDHCHLRFDNFASVSIRINSCKILNKINPPSNKHITNSETCNS